MKRHPTAIHARILLAFLLAPAALVAQDEEPLLGGSIADLFEKGGVVMVLIIAGSVFGLALALERLVALRRTSVAPAPLLAELQRAAASRDVESIDRIVQANQGPLTRILDAGLQRREQGPEAMERVMETVGSQEVSRLKRPVRPLAVLATVEPLLGLLGTVIGMISTFNLLASTSAAERVETLAPGIGQALYTTAAGLCAAIPFVLLYHFLMGRVNRAAEQWSLVGSDVVLALSGAPVRPSTESAPGETR